MPLLTSRDVHVDMALTQASLAFGQSTDAFHALRLFPSIQVDNQFDKYHVFNAGDWLRNEVQEMAPGTEAPGSSFSLSQDTYNAKVYGLKYDLFDEHRANADPATNLEQAAVDYLTEQQLVRRDLQWCNTAYTTSVWTGSTTGGDITPGTLWDSTGSDPIGDICDEMSAIMEKGGRKNNLWKFVTTWDVWCVLKNHPDVLDRIKYTQRGVVDTELFASLIGVDEVVIVRSLSNTAAEGATDVFDYTCGDKDSLLISVARSPGIMVPSAGYTFSWQALEGVSGDAPVISRFRMDEKRMDRFQAVLAYDFKVTATQMGAFFTGVIS